MEQKPIFQTFGLTKRYKESKAVDGLNMTVYEGDIYGFVGENGAGKTTLIRLACGLIHPSEGEFALLGVSNKEPGFGQACRKVSAIVEAVALNRGLTALGNLRLQCKLAGVEKSDEALIQLIRDVGLDYESITKKKAGSFSLGMRQRLGLALALVSDPKFVLLDEPMNGLDPQGFVDMRETILRLNKQGVTFLISSHILSELDKICTRVGFLSHGKLLRELSMDELRDLSRGKITIGTKNVEDVRQKITERFRIKESRCEGDTLWIYDELDVNELMAFLVNEKIRIDSIQAGEETIEDFYRQLMGGEEAK